MNESALNDYQKRNCCKSLNTVQFHQSNKIMTPQELQDQNQRFEDTGGISKDNGALGFLPAFCDTQTGTVYLSRFRDGRLAPIHLLDGLPEELVIQHTPSGQVIVVKASVMAGFVYGGRFLTREQAAQAVREHDRSHPIR
jgi:hypothetical protein